jgi:hypothetical protein
LKRPPTVLGNGLRGGGVHPAAVFFYWESQCKRAHEARQRPRSTPVPSAADRLRKRPNNLDIHGVGTNLPGYAVSWNCYDRLITHEMKTGPNGVPYYDRDKFKGELADDMNIGDMSVTL